MNKKENARNEQSRPLADENKTLRDYVVYLQNAREKEQEILASEIHDKIAQNLLALRLDIAMLHARTQQTHPLINSKASILLREIDVALQNTKNLINQLHAPVFALGLMASLDWKLKEFKKFWGMNCALKMNSDERSLERFNNYTIPLVRILHDALSSALNQRGATSAIISLSATTTHLSIQIIDNGAAGHVEPKDGTNFLAFIGIREYTYAQGGNFSASPVIPQGTALTISLPAKGGGT